LFPFYRRWLFWSLQQSIFGVNLRAQFKTQPNSVDGGRTNFQIENVAQTEKSKCFAEAMISSFKSSVADLWSALYFIFVCLEKILNCGYLLYDEHFYNFLRIKILIKFYVSKQRKIFNIFWRQICILQINQRTYFSNVFSELG
jgi:hypothetical protein